MNETIAGRYRLLEQIGSGGMADVWKAEDLHTGDTVAVKRLHPHLAADQGARARFDREIEAASRVRHPSAVRVLDSGVDEVGSWLAMEHVAGGSLADRLRDGPLPESDALAIAADVADVLAALHAGGMVHRDVTPGNILLVDGTHAMLGDFGIARSATGAARDDVTATGDVVGTLRFLSPEVLAGAPATPASDTWSLGAVLYEALVGRSPFDHTSPAALLASQRQALSIPATLRGDVRALLAKMLQPMAATRPGALEAVASLRAIAGITPSDDRTDVIPVAVARPEGASARAAPIATGAPIPNPAPAIVARHEIVRPVAGVRNLAIAALLIAVFVIAIMLGSLGRPPGVAAPARPTTSPELASPAASSPTSSSPDAGVATPDVPAESGKGKGSGKGNGKGNGKGPKP